MSNEVEVILVEDNMSDATLTIRALRKHHLANNLVHLKDGAEAIEYIVNGGTHQGRTLSSKPKLILLDLKMPKVSGIEVLRQLKGNPKTKTIPVVVLTSSKEDPDVKECYELGVNSYVVKPVDFDAFFGAVSELGLYWLLLNEAPK